MRAKIPIFFIILLLLGNPGAAAAGIAVIVNPDAPVDELKASEIRRIFLGKPTLNKNLNLVPINQPGASQLRLRFEEIVLGKSPRHIRSYWIEKIFTGKGVPPVEAKNADAVIRFVSERIDAIGYIEESQLVNKVKSVLLIP